MKTDTDRQKLAYIVPALILAAGLAVSAVINVTAGTVQETALGPGFDSKEYLRELETYGGTANVLAAEFMQWFEGLWRGRELAFTVAVITVIVSFLVFFTGRRFNSGQK